jgi:hypothetical protein
MIRAFDLAAPGFRRIPCALNTKVRASVMIAGDWNLACQPLAGHHLFRHVREGFILGRD